MIETKINSITRTKELYWLAAFAFRTLYCDLAFYSAVVLQNETQLSHPQRIIQTKTSVFVCVLHSAHFLLSDVINCKCINFTADWFHTAKKTRSPHQNIF